MTEVQFFENSTVSLVKSNVDDASVALAAWVSTYGVDAEIRLHDSKKVGGLINYLMREKHETPFENAGSLTFYVQTPIFVAREHFRHRIGWSYNEMSGRYAELKPNFYLPSMDRPVIQEGKVGQYTFTAGAEWQSNLIRNTQMQIARTAWDYYAMQKRVGIANEVARNVLPLSIMTEYYCTCNPRSLMHFLGLRTAPNALYEIREVAGAMAEILKEQMPITYKAYTQWN